ncbi:germination protein YpeB [Alkaliphilus hydrothermalis]|uniref:Germination protein YpeB n=1 Tax=Alkaliphilus hydrothermalis TaxID=1482730 RepID=A0ABS2NTB9_9FIRM|nr:germination protein YpeB [Alkaliphilus hydrothermalis]MBM7616071.1 germination protein YpeB [Alkaliphilus hydrothermalis]
MRRHILPIVLAIALVATGVWGYQQYTDKVDYHTYLDIQFQRQFYELIGHVENTQVELAKAMVSGSSADTAKYLNDTVAQAYMAQEKLTQLPLNHGAIRTIEKFLSQVGDYASVMAIKSIEGQVLEEKEMDTLQELQGYSNYLAQELIELQKQVVEGGINFGELRRDADRKLDKVDDQMKSMNLIKVEERMQDYPELIYDGPFSEHLKNIKARLKGDTITEEEAIRIVNEEFKEEKITEARVIGKIENTPVEGYYIRAKRQGEGNGREISLAVSKIGGEIIWYLDSRELGESKHDREEATRRAEAFLKKRGYEDMVSTYAMAYEGEMVINFAYKQDDVLVYTDLIKVKVALDNGDIIGMETEGYLINHHERDIPTPEISEEEAKEKLSSGVKVENVRLVIIPTEGRHEILTYEFKVKFGPDNYLIYIDAETGQQRRVLLMIQQEDGTLTI